MSETKGTNRQKIKSLIAKNEGILPTIVIAEIVQITCGEEERIWQKAAFKP